MGNKRKETLIFVSNRGRAPRIDSMQIRYSIRVSDDDDKRISEYCKRTGKNKSDLFREAVNRQMREEKE